MSEQAFVDSWWLLTRARGVGLVLRLLVLVCPLVALACIRAAGDASPVLEFVVVVLTMYCAVVPDGHVGLLVVLLVGLDWMVRVDDTTTPWSLAVALVLLLFHTAMAAAGIAASAAEWTPAMRRRWLRRSGVLALASVASWLLVAAVNFYELAASSALVGAALLVLMVAGLWARDVTLGDGALSRRR